MPKEPNRDIEDHLHDIYGVEASPSLIIRITDKILPAVAEWQSRPLDAIYPIVFLDGIMFKVRKDAKIVNKCVYTVLGINLAEFGEKWSKKYPQISKSWENNWPELSTYFKYPDEVRRLIYTTNTVEGFHRMLRKYTKIKTIFPTDGAVRKSVFLSIQEISKKWSMPIKDWGMIIGQLMIFFEERLDTVA